MPTVPFHEYLVGLALLSITLAGSALTAWLILRRRLAHLGGAAAVTGYGLLATATVIAVHLVPLAFGALARGSVIATTLIAVLAASRLPRAGDLQPDPPRDPAPASSRTSWAVAAIGLFGLFVFVMAYAGSRATEALGSVDALSFHFPHSARWIQTGSLWHIDNFVPGWAFGNYPNNGDVLHLASILPWHNDALVRFATYPMLALAGVAVYAAGTELGGARAASATIAVLVVSLPTVLTIGIDSGLTDSIMHGTFAAGLLFLVRHARTAARSDLVLAGLGVGLALGTKWYGVSSAVAVGAVWVAARLLSPAHRRGLTRDGLLLSAVAAAAGGIWLVRNLLLSGNPVFPVKVELLGLTIFDAPSDPIRERAGFSLVHYLTDLDAWDQLILPQLGDSFGLGGGLLLILAIVALALAVRGHGRVAGVAAGALVLALVYAATPYSAFGPEGEPLLVSTATRYGVPAVLAAAMVAPWVVARLGRFGIVLELAALALVLEAASRYDDFGALADFSIGERRALLGAAAGVVILVAAAAAAWSAPWRHIRRGRGLAAAATASAVIVAGLVIVGDRQQSSYNAGRYLNVDPTYSWLIRNAPEGHRVGLAGLWGDSPFAPPWIAFGPRLGNEVEYVGPWIRERLERHTSEGRFQAALREGRYDLVLVGLGTAAEPTPEAQWTEAAGYVEVARSERLALFRQDSRSASAGRSTRT